MSVDDLLSVLRDPGRGRRNLDALATALGAKRLRELLPALTRAIKRSPDGDMALNNFERVAAACAARGLDTAPPSPRELETLLQLLGTSQFFADLLATRPELLEDLRGRKSGGINLPARLIEELQAEVDAADTDAAVLRAFRRFRQRHLLRVGSGDVLRDRPLEEATRDLSRVADAAVEVALRIARRQAIGRFGEPRTAAGALSHCTIFAFGKLGGEELNYSSDLDLMLVYDHEGATAQKGVGLDEFYTRVFGEVVRLLGAHTADGQAYRVDLRLRPEGARGPLARSLASALAYYDALGRTWERQALIKLRPVAGDLDLGKEFLQAIEPFVWRKYLSFAEINEIKALKRKIEQKARNAGEDDVEVKTGRGGIRDVEFAIQFLQLLNGGDLPEVRQRNTLLAMQALAGAGCLTDQEHQLLSDSYRFLRKTEHRLQLLFDLQTHRLPDAPDELRRLALRMGYGERYPVPSTKYQVSGLPSQRRSDILDEVPPPGLSARDLLVDPLDTFLHDYHAKTRLNRKVLDHLLHQTFAAELAGAEPEADLVLDPYPDEATIRTVLGRYPFRDVSAAYRNLTQLAQESVPFLSTRRCRHFLASIAPRLLRAIAETPDPDGALTNLEKVSASLGGKAVLWELFSVHPPSLKLYVDLCAGSPFLTDLLVGNPGMIDELLDSLVLNRPRALPELHEELAELLRGAADPEPILHSFQDKELLRIGVRDLLGKDDVRATTAALSDLAQAVLGQLWRLAKGPLRERFGPPRLADGRPCRAVLLALGKLGGCEMSYHSDLDLVLVYEGDGTTDLGPGGAATDTLHYFTELARRLIKQASTQGPLGRLYPVDMRLRPAGQSGTLAVALPGFSSYFAGPAAQLWERQAMTRARVVAGDADFTAEVEEAVQAAAYGAPWRPEMADEVQAMRARLEATAKPRSLKRGRGGLVDVEFAVQLLLLKYGSARPEICRSNVWDALDALFAAGLLPVEDYEPLRDGYGFLRQVESRLRIVTNRALTELPESAEDLERLARRLGYEPGGERFLAEWERVKGAVRAAYLRVCKRERGS